MATHSGILAWRITWTEEPDGLQSVGSQRVGHDRGTEQPDVSFQVLFSPICNLCSLYHSFSSPFFISV